MKPEYLRAQQHLDDPQDQSLWPRTPAETKAVEVVKSQRRYNESVKRRAENDRLKKAAFDTRQEKK